ncbi:MAG: hypothetical protein K6E63_03410 [Lachnospiraceae bacterium]|nr:hypothetical protein [Lachnospiraceae bacterium]
MRYLVFLILAIAAGIAIRIKKEYRNRILIALCALVVLLNVFYNARMLKGVMSFIRPVSQTFYQTSYLDTGEYPDSLLMMLFKGRTVYVKNDKCGKDDYGHRHWLFRYYHAFNTQWFLKAAEADVKEDDSINDVSLAAELIDSDFEELGRANDMFRYIFMYNDIDREWGNYFYYYWYYYERLDPIRVFVMTGDENGSGSVFDPGELVVMWNTVDGIENEDIYIMPKDYYDREVAGNE